MAGHDQRSTVPPVRRAGPVTGSVLGSRRLVRPTIERQCMSGDHRRCALSAGARLRRTRRGWHRRGPRPSERSRRSRPRRFRPPREQCRAPAGAAPGRSGGPMERLRPRRCTDQSSTCNDLIRLREYGGAHTLLYIGSATGKDQRWETSHEQPREPSKGGRCDIRYGPKDWRPDRLHR